MMIGETKLGYKITELVGQGGFGTVYKAVKKNKAMETVRALKHISLPSRKQWADIYNSMGNDMARTDEYFDGILQEILNEIRILADLTSKGVKNVVWYYENEIEDTPSPKHYDIYLLMEYLTALPNYIETHEIKVKDVIKIGTDILSALIECHKRKIIHRDIKTDNIFISDDGDFKLGDFGVSKKLSDRSRATSMKGTPNYIAPEVYLGEAYDETVDLYSLGIVLYRLLNYNRNPFMPEYPASYDSEDEDKAFELRMKGETPGYPSFATGSFGDVILKSISNKDNRFKSAAEFKEALENVASSMTEEELNTVVLENVLAKVDFSTFGSKNELTSMANDSSLRGSNVSNVSNISNNSFVNTQQNSFSGTVSNGQTKTNGSKVKIIVPILLAVVAIGVGAFFALKGGGRQGGKFVEVDGISKFLKKNGEYAQNEWVFYNNNEYYFNGRQSLVTNDSVDFNGKTYYVNKDGAKIVNDWYKASNGKQYYLDENGEPYKDTAKNINDEVVFFNKDGEKIVNDWATYEGDYYFIGDDGNMLKNKFKSFGFNEWYYLGSDGKMLKNILYEVDGKMYYFEADGKMKMNSLVLTDGAMYCAGVDGALVKDSWCLNNQYYAGSDGKILTNTTTPDGKKVDASGKRIQETVAYTPIQTTTQANASTGGGSSNIAPSSSASSGVSSISNGAVVWGEHLSYRENVDLDDYGETGGVGKISIDVTKIKDDGSQEVADINSTLQKIFDDACDRYQYELPFKYFELDKTTLSTCNDTQIVIVVTGEIKHTDNETDKMRYKLTVDRAHGSVTFEKVR